MFRNLQAIEIAEGALLADIAVIFQLISVYTPIGTSFFQLPIFIVFTVLVLRRGLYVSVMASGIAIFLVAILVGATTIPSMALIVMAGLFLGVTIRWRMRHVPLVLLGTTCGALALCTMIIFFTLLAGQPLTTFLRLFTVIYQTSIHVIDAGTAHVGLEGWWRQNLYPGVAWLFHFFTTYWLLTLYLCDWVFLCPFVAIIYIATNMTVRLLGYDTRPVLNRNVTKSFQRVSHRVLKIKLFKKVWQHVSL